MRFVEFMLSLCRFISDECGFVFGVEFSELVCEGLRDCGMRWMCFNVVVILRFSVDIVIMGRIICRVNIVNVYMW